MSSQKGEKLKSKVVCRACSCFIVYLMSYLCRKRKCIVLNKRSEFERKAQNK